MATPGLAGLRPKWFAEHGKAALDTHMRLLGDGYALSVMAKKGYARASQEACERYGHLDGGRRGCARCGASQIAARDEWLASKR